jgi:hypothetical protein
MILLLLVCQLEIPQEARIKNPGAYCSWACLEVLARTHDIDKLQGILADRMKRKGGHPDPGYDEVMKDELDRRGVEYEIRNQWSFDTYLLDNYASTLGVAVSLKQGNPYCVGCHHIVVIHCDKMTVQFYDSNTPEKKFWTCSREWFNVWWLGNSLVVFPKAH